VRADRPFDDIHVPVRGTVAVDMEGASFYHSAADFPSTHALLVKGVADYADSEKDDSYHTYAAAASAAYMLSLIKEYVIPTHQPVVSGRTTLPITGGTTPATSQNSPQSMSEQVETEPPKDVFNLFYSYAPEDEALRQKLEKHLKLLQRQGYIADLYGEHKVDVGIDEEQQMNRHLTQSKLILLLLSSSFLASETCHDQMVLALKMQDAGKARVIPILLRPTDDLADTPVGKLRSLPRNNKAITSGGDLDTAFSEIAREIRAIIKLLRE